MWIISQTSPCQHMAYMTENKKPSYRRDRAGRRSLRSSRSFEVTDFGTNRKHVCDFLLINNTNLHPVAHRLPDTAQCYQIIAFDRMCLSLSL